MATDGGVDTKHPDWLDRIDEWKMMRATTRGEKRIKEEGVEWLPMPQGFTKQPDKGLKMYDAYRRRAQFPEFVQPTIGGLTGIICQVEIDVELPDAMMGLWERATKDGLTLEALFQKIIAEIMETGRLGLLADAAPASEGGSELPWLAVYTAESIINWSTDGTFFVLDESDLERKRYTWVDQAKYRVLELTDGVYTQKTVIGSNELESEPVSPTRRGGDRLEQIPFVVVGPLGINITPTNPPLLQVARSALAIYQLSADYRHQLFSTGQETLVVLNADAPDVVGAGVIVEITAKQGKEGHNADAKYVGPKGVGIEAHRTAINDEREVAAQSGAKLFDTESAVQESGEAKKIRYAAQTATLTTISKAGAGALEQALRFIAIMIGQDPEKVIVHPNLQFLDSALTPSEAKALVDMWTGRAISYETLYENLQRGSIASSERTAEEELELIDEEATEDPRETGVLPRNPISGILPPDPNEPPPQPGA
jgi:hypothetical protein